MTFWIVTAAVVAAVVLWIRRANARHHERQQRRMDALRLMAGAAGFVAEHPAELPADMPGWDVATPDSRRTVLLSATRGAARLVVFDHSTSGPPTLGYNNDAGPAGDDRSETSRHTVVCLRHDGRQLPRLELVPNMSRMADVIVDTAGVGADLLKSMARFHARTRERPGAISVGRERLEHAFRVYGADATGVADAVTDEIERLALAHPGLILAADGSWLAFSRNVRLAADGPADGLPLGLQSTAQVEELVSLALAVAGSLTPAD